jgi:hypothetical protein
VVGITGTHMVLWALLRDSTVRLRSTLVTVVSHFPELKTKVEVLRSRCSVDLTEDVVDTL